MKQQTINEILAIREGMEEQLLDFLSFEAAAEAVVDERLQNDWN